MSHLDDDVEWQEWMELTDEQQDAIVERQMAEYQRRLDAMTIAQQVAHHRHFNLEGILYRRRRLRDGSLSGLTCVEDMFRHHIRSAQIRLLKLRIWRATGVYPGATS